MLLALTIPGPPVAKGRPRASVHAGRVQMRTPKSTRDWEAVAATMMRLSYGGKPIDFAVALSVIAVKARPKKEEKRGPAGRYVRTTKPDTDNVMKAVADALTMAGVLLDDRFVAEWHGVAMYTARGEKPCVEVRLREITTTETRGPS